MVNEPGKPQVPLPHKTKKKLQITDISMLAFLSSPQQEAQC